MIQLKSEYDATLQRLLACDTRARLKVAWLSLTDDARTAMRPDRRLASHARSVLGIEVSR